MRDDDRRLPDRGSVLEKGGDQWTVVDLTTRYVRLLGDRGTLDVPIWRWPDGYSAVAAAEEEGEGRPIRALLVGGESGRHLDRIEELARAQGVDIVMHWPMDMRRLPSKQIPGHVELVIWLVSHMGHSAYDASKRMASGQGISTAHVPSAGFESALSAELDRLGLRRTPRFSGQYEMPVATPAQGRYVWTGTTWSWQDAEESPVVADGGGSGGGGEDVVAGILSLVALLAVFL